MGWSEVSKFALLPCMCKQALLEAMEEKYTPKHARMRPASQGQKTADGRLAMSTSVSGSSSKGQEPQMPVKVLLAGKSGHCLKAVTPVSVWTIGERTS